MLLLLHAAATLFMAGLIWFVQVVHYPLTARVGAGELASYQAEHMRTTTWVVGPPMLLELATVVWLVADRPADVPITAAWAGMILLAVVWASTALLQVPAHNRLLHDTDAGAVRTLVQTNWIRTVAWTLRAVLALALLT